MFTPSHAPLRKGGIQFLALTASLFLGVASAQISALQFPKDSISIVHTNDVLGEIEPCGCRSNPQGGMLRLEGLLEEVTKNSKASLLVDAGDLLFASTEIPELLIEPSKLQAETLFSLYAKLGLVALSPGEKDLALGLPWLQAQAKKNRVALLSINWVNSKGSPLFKPTLLLNRAGVKFGIIGVTGPASTPPSRTGSTTGLAFPKHASLKGAQILEPVALLKKEVAALRKKVDVLMVLSHAGIEEDRKLAQAVPGVDLWVGAHTQSFLQTPEQVGKGRIVQSSFRNQWVGIQSVALSPALPLGSYQLISLDESFDQKPASSSGPPLSADPSRPPESSNAAKAASPVKRGIAEFKQKLEALNQKLSEKENRKLELELLQPARPKPSFMTFPRCAECHWKQFDFWRKTSHAKALTPLALAHQIINRECISCHSLGFGDSKGFKDPNHLAEIEIAAWKQALDEAPESEESSSSEEVQNDLSNASGSPFLMNPSSDAPQEKGQLSQSKSKPTLPPAIEDRFRSKNGKLSQSETEALLKKISEAPDLNSKIEVLPGLSPVGIPTAMKRLHQSWVPVQCENCHRMSSEHPVEELTSKPDQASFQKLCLNCHTIDRAPGWYDSQKKLNGELFQKKLQSVSCPKGDLSVRFE